MTTVVSRLFADEATAEQAVTALKLQKHPDGNIDVIGSGNSATDEMIEARVPSKSAELYSAALSKGRALVVCRAPFFPAGAARNAIDTMNMFETVDAGVSDENYYIREEPNDGLYIDISVDRTHRYWGSWAFERENYGVGTGRPPSGRKHWGSFFGPPLMGAGKFWGSIMPPLTGAGKHWGSIMAPLAGAGKHWGSIMPPLTGAGKYWGSPFAHPLAAAGKHWGSPTGETVLKSHPHMGSFLLSPLGGYKESKD